MGVVVAGILSRSLGTAGFGDFASALAIVTVALALVDSGMNQVATREMAANPADRGEIAAAFIVFRALGSAVLTPVALLCVVLLLDGRPAQIAGALVVATLPLSIVSGLQNVAYARLRAEIPIVLMVGQSVLWLAVCGLVAATGGGIEWFGLGFLVTGVVTAAATALAVRRLVVVDFAGWRSRLGGLVRFALPLALAGMMVTVYYRVDALILRSVSGATETGYYTAAYRFLDAAQALPATVFAVALPLLSALRRESDGERYRRTAGFCLGLAALVSLPVAATGLLAGSDIVRLVYGEDFGPAGPLAAIVLLAFPFICTAWILMSILLADNVLWPYVAIACFVALVSVGGSLALMPRYGATAAAWITVVTEALVVILAAALVWRRTQVRLPLRRIAGALVAAGGMLAVGYLCGGLPWPVGLAAGLVVYGVVALALGVVTRSELRTLVSRREALQA